MCANCLCEEESYRPRPQTIGWKGQLVLLLASSVRMTCSNSRQTASAC
jgi:hypothetical protein